jgi:hypothetical protein
MEVRFDAVVAGPPHLFAGLQTHAVHACFEVLRDDGRRFEIVDNLALAPFVPVRPGDRVTVAGELILRPGRDPLVHWTHHDPAHRHVAGFIDWNGRRYA